jgi:uncharacterized membrane protein YeaQ/YmgE (transglycosylase-associated protein family)
VGAIIAWIGSVVMRKDTQGGILLYIAMGAVGGVVGPLIVFAGSLFHSALAAALGAMIFVLVLGAAQRFEDSH